MSQHATGFFSTRLIFRIAIYLSSPASELNERTNERTNGVSTSWSLFFFFFLEASLFYYLLFRTVALLYSSSPVSVVDVAHARPTAEGGWTLASDRLWSCVLFFFFFFCSSSRQHGFQLISLLLLPLLKRALQRFVWAE